MDNLTHGLLGAALAQVLQKKTTRYSAMAAFAAANFADLDVLIRSKNNPLLFIEYHRGFTHSLVFIPLGALLSAILFWLVFGRKKHSLKETWLASLIGYLTHPLLDTCTSFGTQLLWPFTHHRFSWDIISIVDPAFTLILLVGFIWFMIRRFKKPAQIALVLSAIYLGFGIFQHHQAQALQQNLAQTRGQIIERGRVLPTFFNLFLWRSIYISQGKVYADALYTIPGAKQLYWPGESTELFSVEHFFKEHPGVRTREKELNLYQWFSDGYLGKIAQPNSALVVDLRYAPLPNQLRPIWALFIPFQSIQSPIERVGFNLEIRERLKEFLEMLWNEKPGAIPLSF